MSSPPSENTLTVNNTHQMLSDLENRFQTLSVLSPSRKMENILGYDINLPLLKSVVFQYKRPYTVENDSKRRFQVNQDQLETLISLYHQGEAFFVLPEVTKHNKLNNSLMNTVFIDVWGLKPNTSLFYVPKDVSNSTSPRIEAKHHKEDKYYTVGSRFVYDWNDLRKGIKSCNLGLRLKSDDEIADGFERLRSRVRSLDRGEIGEVIENIRAVARENEDEWRTPLGDIEKFEDNLREAYEEDKDLTTRGIRRSRHVMLGN